MKNPFNRVSVTIAGLTITTMLLAAVPSFGAEVYLDRNCQRVSGPSDAYRVDFRRNIQPGGQEYWFSMARYQDGSAIFCLTRPNYMQGQRLAVKQLQNQFIREVKQESRETSFLITVAYGNGFRVPLTQFRLNLDSPTQPTLSKLREWRDNSR